MKRYNQLVEGISEITVARKNDGSYRVLGSDQRGESFDTGDLNRKQLDDYVGERTAQNIESKFAEQDQLYKEKDEPRDTNVFIHNNPDANEYETIELDVDDLKMPKDPRHFLMIAYDKVLKNAAQKLGKKYDAKVGVGDIQTTDIKLLQLRLKDPLTPERKQFLLEKGKEKVWTLDISEKLKSAAEKGLPYMAVVPPAAMMMNQEQDRTPINRAAARPIMENYAN